MSKPLFADSWYETPRVPELRQEIQNLYKEISITPLEVSGSTGGNAALESLIEALVELGLITDSTT
jgi:hypothetical protein